MNTTRIYKISLLMIALPLASILIMACNGSVDDGGGTGRQLGSSIFPPAVFIADKDVKGVD